jgi:hypothetical protein
MSKKKDTVRINRKELEKLKANAHAREEMEPMSKKNDTVTIPRKAWNDIKALAAEAVADIRSVRAGAHIVKDGNRRKQWVETEGLFKAKKEGEIQSIQNRSAVRSAGVGALLAFVANWDMIKNSEYVKKYWWLLPLAVLAVGWIAKKKGYKDAPALLTFGGVLLVQAYQKHRDEEAKKSAPPQQPASPTTAGFTDTGALHPMGNYAWLQDPFGKWVKLALPASLPQMLPSYAANFRALPAPANSNTAGPTQEDYEAAQQLAAAAFAA